MRFRKNHLVHWIAAFAILMSALAPAISQAMSVSNGDGRFVMEICSTNGEKIVQTLSSSGEDSKTPMAEMKHCPYCVVQSVYVATPSATISFEAPADLAIFPKLFYQSPKLHSVWVTPPSAAPPTQA